LKTQIITLESHDDLISVRDKLSWAKTPRILLVWPKYEKVTLRVLDLKVLQRHADSLGAQLGLVTRRANVRRDAESLGIPVFESTAAAQKDLWPDSAPRSQRVPNPPRRDLRDMREIAYPKEPAWRTSLIGRVVVFTVGVLAFVAVSSLFVPRAAVTLYPEAQVQTAVIPVAASETFASVSITGNIPAHNLSATFSTEQTLAITSEISVPKDKAQGVARFKNLSQGEVNIPAGTVIATEGETPARFVTLHDTLLKPGVDEFVDVPIESLQLGLSGNVGADEIKIVEGPLGLSISVTNPSLTKGGRDETLTGATDEDREKLRESVIDNLRREAESRFRVQIMPDDLLLMDTFEATKIIEETFTPADGQPGKLLTLKMEIEFTARYVSVEDMKQLTIAALDASIPERFESFGKADFKPLTDPSTDSEGVTHFEIEVKRTLLRKMDFMQVFSILQGKGTETAKTELASNLSLRQQPDIVITPSWWKWLPIIPFNISLETK
jgi:hypothetical protein